MLRLTCRPAWAPCGRPPWARHDTAPPGPCHTPESRVMKVSRVMIMCHDCVSWLCHDCVMIVSCCHTPGGAPRRTAGAARPHSAPSARSRTSHEAQLQKSDEKQLKSVIVSVSVCPSACFKCLPWHSVWGTGSQACLVTGRHFCPGIVLHSSLGTLWQCSCLRGQYFAQNSGEKNGFSKGKVLKNEKFGNKF